MTKRLTKQRYDAIISAMAYYQTVIEDEEENGDIESRWKDERRNHESAMEWLWSIDRWYNIKGEQQ